MMLDERSGVTRADIEFRLLEPVEVVENHLVKGLMTPHQRGG
jgi:hypothetical protein